MTMPTAQPPASSHSLARLMLMGFLSGIISAMIAAATLLALSYVRFYGTAEAGSAVREYTKDLPDAVFMAFLWFLPVGIFIFPPAAKVLGAATKGGTLRLMKFVVLAAILWFLLAEAIYLALSPLAPAPPGVQRDDLISAALSGVLFAVVYDLLLRRRDYLLDRKPR
jgi:hypothetical protein